MRMEGPKAPRDPEKKRAGFYIMRNKEIAGSGQADGSGVQFIYLNDGRMISSAELVGNITDSDILELLKTTQGFKQLVHSIGVCVDMENADDMVDFAFQMYGKSDIYGSGTTIKKTVKADGMENIIVLSQQVWSQDDDIPGQIRFHFEKEEQQATVSVKLYLNDGYTAPQPQEETTVDFASPHYQNMIEKSLVQMGNNIRLKKALDKAHNKEDMTIAFIGGSITQGAGAIPINTKCYAYQTYEGLCELTDNKESIHYIKAGVGGTPSELGMIRFERDVLRDGTVSPDIVVVEFAVNDEGDETKGECYDSLVRKIWNLPNKPAVILLFSVFASDFNLQERLSVVGEKYQLPMVSTRDSVVEQFYKKSGQGRVVTKNQFFYDCFHPTNIGHKIMADGLLNLFRMADASKPDLQEISIAEIKAPLGDEFATVKLIDRKEHECVRMIECGDFNETDEELQAVEMDKNLKTTKEFPNNWMHKSGNKPFCMDIECSALLIVTKDSGSPQCGCAQVWVDDEKVLDMNPQEVGWTHCNAQICFRKREKCVYHVEIRMKEGYEDKEFTILGFGVV